MMSVLPRIDEPASLLLVCIYLVDILTSFGLKQL